MVEPSGVEARALRALCRAGAIGALAGAALTLAWLATLLPAPPSTAGTTADHLRELGANGFWHDVSFALQLPLAFLFAPVWIALAARGWRAHPVSAVLVVAFGLLYVPFTTIDYWSQLTVAHGLADAYGTDPAAAVAAYRLFDLGSDGSLVLALDLAGYAILGPATLGAAVLLWPGSQTERLAAGAFAVSAALSIGGAIGAAAGIPLAEAGAIAAGPPFLIGIAATGVVLRRESLGPIPFAQPEYARV